MAAPASLTGAPTTITVDGVDLHVYGMTVLHVDNPIPSAIDTVAHIPGRNGGVDFTRNIGVRQMAIQGNISADSHVSLMTYIDALNELFRLRENGSTFQVIFSDQSSRYWSCRYVSFSAPIRALRNYGRTASYTLRLACVKPYSEATTLTWGALRLSSNKSLVHDYAGTIKAPINFNLISTAESNLLEVAVAGNASSDYTQWAYSNAVGSDDATYFLYGLSSVLVTRSAAGGYYCEADVTAQIDVTKNYVFGAFIRKPSSAILNIQAVLDGVASVEASFGTDSSQWTFVHLALTSTDLAGVANIRFRIYGAADGPDSFYLDGAFVYEAHSYDSNLETSAYIAPPYISNDETPKLVNPKINLFQNRNIFPWKNGDALTDWVDANSHLALSNNPNGSGIVLAYQSESNHFSKSPPVYISGGKTYKFSLDYFIKLFEDTGASEAVNIDIYYYSESGVAITFSANALSAATPNWVTLQATVDAPAGATICRVDISNNNCKCKVFIKDIMIVEELVDEEAFISYLEPSLKYQVYTGTIETNDEVQIDNDTLVVKYNDFSAKTIANGMGSFSGDLLELVPGYNVLRLTDARLGSADPEDASIGTAGVLYSYRARYL